MIYRARTAKMQSCVDQEDLNLKISQWQASHSDDNWYFRSYVTAEVASGLDCDEDQDVTVSGEGRKGLLLIHQTSWQRSLLAKYGCMCLLDATYKTTRYALPLFFLCVRTNVDYIVVAEFFSQYEDSQSIAEALEQIKLWNTEWIPKSFMVDCCEAEIKALETVFKGLSHEFAYVPRCVHAVIVAAPCAN
jgi:MULE transposase domain